MRGSSHCNPFFVDLGLSVMARPGVVLYVCSAYIRLHFAGELCLVPLEE